MLRIGDYIVYNNHNERITEINSERVLCGITISVPLNEVKTPQLTEQFFKMNDFKYEKKDGVDTYTLGAGETFVYARKNEGFFMVAVKNRLFDFSGPVDELNELLHAIDACAINTESFVCD